MQVIRTSKQEISLKKALKFRKGFLMVNCGVMKVHWNLGDVTISEVIKKQR
jgi:hypothetical protein